MSVFAVVRVFKFLSIILTTFHSFFFFFFCLFFFWGAGLIRFKQVVYTFIHSLVPKMFRTATTVITPLLLGLVAAQSPDNTTEGRPKLTTYKCTTSGGCVAQNNSIVLDSSQHHIYQLNNPDYGCGDWGSAANETACPDLETCQQNCILEGIPDYTAHGVSTNGSDLTLLMLGDDGSEYSPRLYLLNEAEDAYEMLQLTGQEFTFDVDMSKLPCGMNSALYTVEMEAKGGQGSGDVAVAGAPYGTGYCDAQCYTTPFQNGVVSNNNKNLF